MPGDGGEASDAYPYEREAEPPGNQYGQRTFSHIGNEDSQAIYRSYLPVGVQGADIATASLPYINTLLKPGDDVGKGDGTQQITDNYGRDNI